MLNGWTTDATYPLGFKASLFGDVVINGIVLSAGSTSDVCATLPSIITPTLNQWAQTQTINTVGGGTTGAMFVTRVLSNGTLLITRNSSTVGSGAVYFNYSTGKFKGL